MLALGVSGDDKTVARAFRFEIWEHDLVIHRETEKEADVASVRQLSAGPGRAQLRAYLDQEKGRILVYSLAGQQLADLKVASPGKEAFRGIYLANKHGDARLERLRVSRWTSETSRETNNETYRVQLTDGSAVNAEVTRLDTATHEFVTRGPQGESRIAEDRVAGIRLASPGELPQRSIRLFLPGWNATERRPW